MIVIWKVLLDIMDLNDIQKVIEPLPRPDTVGRKSEIEYPRVCASWCADGERLFLTNKFLLAHSVLKALASNDRTDDTYS